MKTLELDLDSCCLAPRIDNHVCLNCKRQTRDAARFTAGFYSVIRPRSMDKDLRGWTAVGGRNGTVYTGGRK